MADHGHHTGATYPDAVCSVFDSDVVATVYTA